MSKYLPERIFPLKLVEAGQRYFGVISTQTMARLKCEVVDPPAECRVDLQFARDAQGEASITGAIEVTLTYICQRCLEPVAIPIHADVDLKVRKKGQRATADGDDEILEIGDEAILLQDLVEDELLLSEPYIAKHSWDCTASLVADGGQLPDTSDEEKPNPFAVLASLKSDTPKS